MPKNYRITCQMSSYCSVYHANIYDLDTRVYVSDSHSLPLHLATGRGDTRKAAIAAAKKALAAK